MAKDKKRIKRRKINTLNAKSNRRVSRKKRGLSELFSPETAQATGKVVLGGIIGGVVYKLADKLIKTENNLLKHGLMIGMASFSGAILKQPNIAAGMSGAIGLVIAEKLFSKDLSEMEPYDYTEVDDLEMLPEALDENGDEIYLSEFEQANLYPNYVNTSIF